MGSNSFKFKQFTVFHDRCAMKVGTDGVLLGAWADIGGCRSILDVGTGSGLIALMMAQRNGLASITAIEIDSDAAMQARENVICFPFRGRIEVLPLSLQEFQSTVTGKFDAIVSNPPFFVNSLPSPDLRRTGARHAGSLTADELFSISRKLLSESGTLSLIYPFQDRELVMAAASRGGFGLLRETVVYPTPTLPPKRVLMEFTAGPGGESVGNDLVIEEERHRYSPAFATLVRDFYLYL